MSEPLVAAIMLTKDRPAMARRAVECFSAQTYTNKRLYVFDTGEMPCIESIPDGFPDFGIIYHRGIPSSASIGALRNNANWWGVRPSSTAVPDADIIVHFDDDDYSHPSRIAEQVALLQWSGADAVGYREMVFWKEPVVCRTTRHPDNCMCGTCGPGYRGVISGPYPAEAWLYASQSPELYALGTSLCYWRSVWEAKPFLDIGRPDDPNGWGEDYEFCRGLKLVGRSSLIENVQMITDVDYIASPASPRMIASLHGGNTCAKIDPAAEVARGSREWRRAPEWAVHCRRVMGL